MLETLRQNLRKLSWTLWLVIAAFIILYIPDLVRSPQNVVATVDGEPIYAQEYQEAYRQQVNYYRSLNEGDLPDDLLEQIQLDRVVLEQLVRQRIMLQEAQEQGFGWTPQEVRNQLLQFEAFRDESGQFVGTERYRQILRANGMEVDHFESHLIQDVLTGKLTNFVTEGITVTDGELEEAYQRRNEQVALSYLVLEPGRFEDEVDAEISDEEVRAHFEADREAYRMPERRRVTYALLDTEEMRGSVDITEDRLREAYEQEIEQHTLPDQIHARHILLRVPPGGDAQQEAGVRAEAEQVLERLRAGADFAEMAREHSDDPTATAGGDLGWISRGRMVEGFDEVAFALEEGELSDVVRTPFGFHIIMVEGRREGRVRPFDEVRAQIEQRLAWERAEERAAEIADEIRRQVLRGAELETIAEEHGLELHASGLFSESAGLDAIPSPEFTSAAFRLGSGRVAEPLRVRQGHVVFRVDEIVDPQVPRLADVQDLVRHDLRRQRAAVRVREVAEELADRLSAGEAVETVAAELGVEARQTEPLTRNDPVPQLGRAAPLMSAAFDLQQGEVGGPVQVGDAVAVFRVTEHRQPDWARFGQQRAALRQELLNERRNKVFEALLQELRQRYEVVVYDDVLGQLTS